MAEQSNLSRRTLLIGGAAGAGGLALGVAGARAQAGPAAQEPATDRVIAFHGEHQAGVTTAPQTHAALVAFNLAESVDREAAIRLMHIWTDDIRRLMAAEPGLADTEPELATSPAGLTVTVAVGPGFFDAIGLTDQRPSWLEQLPAFSIDRLEDAYSGGDLLLQICADDELVVAHALRLLTKEARTFTSIRWVQRGFRGVATPGSPPRNLMGQIDGTVNPTAEQHDALVWVGDGSATRFGRQPDWLTGGTSMVVRRIAMELETWDELDRSGRERTIGRRLEDGVPLSGGTIDDLPDLDAVDENGLEVIDSFAHVRRARPDHDDQRILRRPYNYDDQPAAGELSNSGLLFITFQADVSRQFLPIQQRLAELDLLNQWTTPVGSAVFAVLPGVPKGSYLAEPLLG